MRPSTWGQRWGSGRPEVAGSTSARAAAAWPPLPRAPQASRAADVRPAGLAPARGRGDVTTPEAPLSVLPPSLVARGWWRGASPVCAFSHVPVAAAWGARGRGPRRPRRADVRVRCSLSRAAHRPPLCPVPGLPVGGSGALAVPPSTWPAGWAGRAVTTTSPAPSSALRLCVWCPGLRLAPAADRPTRPEVRVACPGAQALQCRCLGLPAVPGVLAGVRTARAVLHPSTRVLVAGLRPPGPAVVDPGPAASDQNLPPCSVLWPAGAQAPFSPTFGGVAGARAQAHFLARRPRALPASEGGAPTPVWRRFPILLCPVAAGAAPGPPPLPAVQG